LCLVECFPFLHVWIVGCSFRGKYD
jgi:hypothetical protein